MIKNFYAYHTKEELNLLRILQAKNSDFFNPANISDYCYSVQYSVNTQEDQLLCDYFQEINTKCTTPDQDIQRDRDCLCKILTEINFIVNSLESRYNIKLRLTAHNIVIDRQKKHVKQIIDLQLGFKVAKNGSSAEISKRFSSTLKTHSSPYTNSEKLANSDVKNQSEDEQFLMASAQQEIQNILEGINQILPQKQEKAGGLWQSIFKVKEFFRVQQSEWTKQHANQVNQLLNSSQQFEGVEDHFRAMCTDEYSLISLKESDHVLQSFQLNLKAAYRNYISQRLTKLTSILTTNQSENLRDHSLSIKEINQAFLKIGAYNSIKAIMDFDFEDNKERVCQCVLAQQLENLLSWKLG